MEIIGLQAFSEDGEAYKKAYLQLEGLLSELRGRELPDAQVTNINLQLSALNESGLKGADLAKLTRKKQQAIVTMLEKDLKVVPKNHYTGLWMVLGMTAFGIPFGMAFGFSLGNPAFIGLGMPIGMGLGIAIGSSMDAKALQEGRQLQVELK